MLFVYTALTLLLFLTAWGTSHFLVGLIAAALVPVIASSTSVFNAMLVGWLIAGFAWGNLPVFPEVHGHDDGHGHAPAAPEAKYFWEPWGIVYRLATSAVVGAFIAGFFLAVSDANTRLLWTDRAQLTSAVLMIIRAGAGGVALLVAYIIATSWGSAQAQG